MTFFTTLFVASLGFQGPGTWCKFKELLFFMLALKGIFHLNFKIKITISLFDLTIASFDFALLK